MNKLFPMCGNQYGVSLFRMRGVWLHPLCSFRPKHACPPPSITVTLCLLLSPYPTMVVVVRMFRSRARCHVRRYVQHVVNAASSVATEDRMHTMDMAVIEGHHRKVFCSSTSVVVRQAIIVYSSNVHFGAVIQHQVRPQSGG